MQWAAAHAPQIRIRLEVSDESPRRWMFCWMFCIVLRRIHRARHLVHALRPFCQKARSLSGRFAMQDGQGDDDSALIV